MEPKKKPQTQFVGLDEEHEEAVTDDIGARYRAMKPRQTLSPQHGAYIRSELRKLRSKLKAS